MQPSMTTFMMQLRGTSSCMGMTVAATGTATMAPPMPLTPETKPPTSQAKNTSNDVVSGIGAPICAPA